MTVDTELHGRTVVLRPTVRSDGPELIRIRSTPEVRRWWRGDDVEAEFAEDLADVDTCRFTIRRDDRIVGLVQYAEETDPEYRHASIDVYVDPACHRQGVATDAIRTVVDHLIDQCGHHRITIDPSVDNAAAIACYRSVGFEPVGVMRQYEQRADGSWGDGLLLDLVASDRSDAMTSHASGFGTL